MEFRYLVSLSQERAGALFDAADVDKSGTVDFEAGALTQTLALTTGISVGKG